MTKNEFSAYIVTVRGEQHTTKAYSPLDAMVHVCNTMGLRYVDEKVSCVPETLKPKKEFPSLRRVK